MKGLLQQYGGTGDVGIARGLTDDGQGVIWEWVNQLIRSFPDLDLFNNVLSGDFQIHPVGRRRVYADSRRARKFLLNYTVASQMKLLPVIINDRHGKIGFIVCSRGEMNNDKLEPGPPGPA